MSLEAKRVPRREGLNDKDDRPLNAMRKQLSLKQQTLQGEPLLNRVKNLWQDNEKYSSTTSTLSGTARSSRVRRILVTWITILLLGYLTWRWSLGPGWVDERAYREGFLSIQEDSFDIAKGGHFDGTRIMDLDPSLIPGGSKDRGGKKRLIFVGDIHGCRDELQELLAKIRFNEKHDHLIATGDVISKGEDSPGVLDELIRLKATSVRGNHEDRLLQAAKTELDKQDKPRPLAESSDSNRAKKDRDLLKQLSKEHLRYLRNMPLVLRIPALPLALPNVDAVTNKKHPQIDVGMLVVHAGLVPGVALEKQDPYYVMNMRSMDRRTRVPSTTHSKQVPWYTVWNWYQARFSTRKIPLNEPENTPLLSHGKDVISTTPQEGDSEPFHIKPQVVIYGHDSKAGLQDHRWSKGIDTRCVNGGKLTAMILDARGTFEYKKVKCRGKRS